MTVLVLLLMVLLHIIDDFVLQLQSLSELKQKKTWEGTPDMYKNDYLEEGYAPLVAGQMAASAMATGAISSTFL